MSDFRPKTAECWQCGGREGFVGAMEETVWVRSDGTEFIRENKRFQCSDYEACDKRVHENAMKARIIGTGPVTVKL